MRIVIFETAKADYSKPLFCFCQVFFLTETANLKCCARVFGNRAVGQKSEFLENHRHGFTAQIAQLVLIVG